MAFYSRKKESLNEKKIHLLYGMSFLLGLCGSLVMYTASSYFSEAWNTENIGWIYFFVYSISFLELLFFDRLVYAWGKSMVLFFLLFSQILVFLGLSSFDPSPLPSIFLILGLFLGKVLWTALDSLLEGYSVDSRSGRIRGIFLASMNAGLFFGPFLSTKIIDVFGYQKLYTLTLVLFCFLLILSMWTLSLHNQKISQTRNLRDVFHEMKNNKDLFFIYWLAFTLEVFYAVMIIFTPLYLTSLGMSFSDIGIILSLALLPFIFLQYPVGYIADRFLGEKELMIVALTIMGMGVFCLPFLESNSVFLWSSILIFGRVGASFLEVLRDSYFYKKIDGDAVGLISYFRTAGSLGYIVVALTSSLFLVFFDISQVFWLAFICIVLALYPALSLRDNHAFTK